MNINASMIQSYYIWFRLRETPLLQIIGDPLDVNEVKYRFGFDYEKISATDFRIYIDTQVQTFHAGLMYRCAFQFKIAKATWDEIFSTNLILPLVSAAIETTCRSYNELCKENNVSAPVLKFDKSIEAGVTENIINLYFDYRKKDDIANEYLMNNNGITFTKGRNTIVLLQCTFIILDAFLYDCTEFDNQHNMEEFEQMMPFTKYLTLKFNCREIEIKSVKLSFLNLIQFVQCVDCALKLMLGDKTEILIPRIEKRGMDEEIRELYFTEGGKFVKHLNESFKKSGARVINLEKFYDWDAIFR
jgi:hypothetical protein